MKITRSTYKLLAKKNQFCIELVIRERPFGITMSHKIINRIIFLLFCVTLFLNILNI